MATAWTISQLDCVPQENDKTDVVVTAHWECTATQDTFSSKVYGTTSFTLDQGGSFTPYNQLTQDQVLGWVWQSVNKDATEISVNSQLQAQISPAVVTPPLPWQTLEAPI